MSSTTFDPSKELTPAQITELAASLGIDEASLKNPPRKELIHDLGYRVKVTKAEYKVSTLGGPQANLKVTALDGNGKEVKGATALVFLPLPYDTAGFKFRDAEAREKAYQAFKTVLFAAKPELQLIKRVDVSGTKKYYNPKTDSEIPAGAVNGLYQNERIVVITEARKMETSQSVAALAGATFYGVWNVWTRNDGKVKKELRMLSTEKMTNFTYATEASEMVSYPEGADGAEGDSAASDEEVPF